MKETIKIGIIGGGAAGMMAAATILDSIKGNYDLLLFDKNEKLGVKVALTGGGRCNVTTGINDQRLLLSKYTRGSQFLKPALSAFPPLQVRDWFIEHGVSLKEEDDARVFPESNKSEDIINVFYKIFEKENIKLHLGEAVNSVKKISNGFEIHTEKDKYIVDKLIITTGGNAFQNTGSSGDGYAFARDLRHTITKLGPSLGSFTTRENWCYELSGVSLPQAKILFTQNNSEVQSLIGPILFTHFGISGPVVFALSSHLAFEEISALKPIKIKLIPDKDFTYDFCNKRLIEEIKKRGKDDLEDILKIFIPKHLAQIILDIAQVSTMLGADLTKEERLTIVKLLTGELELTLTSRRAGVEFVTAGGVELEEVNRKTMQSKLVNNLFFAGEILNIDGLTGGFNLQAAWATGRVAGLSALT